SSALKLDQAEGVDETNLANFCAEIKDSLERDKGVSTRVVLVPIPRLGKRLGAPPFVVVVSVSKPSHVGTSAPACGVVSGHARKSGAEKDKFFLIDCRAILDYLTWRHSCSCVSDDLPTDGYDRNDSDAKVVEESHHLSLPLLERVPSHTTAPAIKGAIIPLPTPDEIVSSLPDLCLAKKSKGSS
nr:hypothetical protein [Tanacetum cinerariifolium]